MLGDGTLDIKENKFINTAHISWGQKEKDYNDWTINAIKDIAKATKEVKSIMDQKMLVEIRQVQDDTSPYSTGGGGGYSSSSSENDSILPPTGILMTIAPFAAMVGLGAALIALFAKKRKNEA